MARSSSRTAFLLAVAGLMALACADAPRRLSIVIVVLDAARADHFGAYGYPRDATPHFDAWAQESVIFEQAISNASYTQPSVASLLSGQPPGRHQAVYFGRGLDPAAQTLAEILMDAGYRTTTCYARTTRTTRCPSTEAGSRGRPRALFAGRRPSSFVGKKRRTS